MSGILAKSDFKVPATFIGGPDPSQNPSRPEVGELDTRFVKVDTFRRVVGDTFEGLPEETKPYFSKGRFLHFSDKTLKVPTWIHLSLSLAP